LLCPFVLEIVARGRIPFSITFDSKMVRRDVRINAACSSSTCTYTVDTVCAVVWPLLGQTGRLLSRRDLRVI
jgi:hypothetical protein